MSYTKGPWTVIEQGDADEYCFIDVDKKWLLAFRHNGDHNLFDQRANIKLIASAPDLLEALESLTGIMKFMGEYLTDSGKQEVLKALNVIKKATE